MDTAADQGRHASRARPPAGARQHQRRLTPVQAASLVREYEGGESVKVLIRYAVHRATVNAILKRAGVELRARVMIDAETSDEAVTLYIRGWSLAKLGTRYDCAADTVRLALLARGVTMRRPWERG